MGQARIKHKKGIISTYMVSFKCDLYHKLWLDSQPNKGRYINNLIQEDRLKKEG